ncbi:T6SS phospholipase effector Tle1-like catalytic domain-containing protein [Pseudomonas serbica]
MSEVKHASMWYPPAFPVEGRLPRSAAQVHQNNRCQCQLEADYHDALCVAAGRRLRPPCCKTLHISLLFESDLEADKGVKARAEEQRDQNQAEVVKRRKQQRAREFLRREPNMPLEPGVKDFDADMAQIQLREAAEEFGKAYRGADRFPQALKFAGPMGMASSVLYQKLTAEVQFERQRMKASGQARVGQLFPPPLREINHQNETRRGNVDESRNAAHPEGLLRALFDDQVHDSRAWFMYTLGRERTGSYFGERMVFFGEAGRRDLALYGENGEVLARTIPNAGPAGAAQPLDAELLAQAMQDIDALWEALHAQAGEVKNASA